jgi:hypothetical protein
MVNYYGYEITAQAMDLTNSSRAMAHLIVLERDRMVMQSKIDEILCTCQERITLEIICHAVKTARKEMKEASSAYHISGYDRKVAKRDGSEAFAEANSVLEWDELLACIRYNVIPPVLLRLNQIICEPPNRCKTFSDLLNTLCNSEKNSNWMKNCILSTTVDTLYFSHRFMIKRWSVSDRIAKLNSLNFKNDFIRISLLSFHEEWEKRITNLLQEDRDPNSRAIDISKSFSTIRRILMIAGL